MYDNLLPVHVMIQGCVPAMPIDIKVHHPLASYGLYDAQLHGYWLLCGG